MTLADILVAHRHDMLRLWMQAVRREAPETQGLSDADLTSNFPLLFDRLIRGLEGEPPPPTMPESRAHAATRKRQGIGLPTLLREYTLLQQTIRTFAAEMLGARPGDTESRTIDAILFRAVEEAVLTYTATKEAELALAKGRSDHLIAALAHDIRSPLNAMALTLTLMEMKLGDRLDAEDREDMASMRAGITAVLDLHDGILDQSKLAAGHVVARPTAFPLDVAIGELRPGGAVVGQLQGDCGREGPGGRGDGSYGSGDAPAGRRQPALQRHPLHRAGVDHGPQPAGGRWRAGGGGGHGHRDDAGGPGPDLRGVLPGGRDPPGDRRGLRPGPGRGKRMASLMGGDLSVTSEPGKGSRFTLSLLPSVLEATAGS